MFAGSEPPCGSVRPKQAITSPFAMRGSQRLLLLLAAEGVDRIHAQARLHRHEAAQAGIAALELLADQPVRDRVQAGAAVAVDRAAEQSELRDRGTSSRGKRSCSKHSPMIGITWSSTNFADGVLHQPLLVAEHAANGVQVERIELGGDWAWRCGGMADMGFSSAARMIAHGPDAALRSRRRFLSSLRGAGVAYAGHERTVDQWLDEYGASHQNPATRCCTGSACRSSSSASSACCGLCPCRRTCAQSSPLLNWGTVLLVAAVLYYLAMSWSLALGMVVFVGSWCSRPCVAADVCHGRCGSSAWRLFVVAWIGQFIGHHYEGKRPSFFKDVQFLMIGPLWLLSFIYRKLRIPY